MKQAELFDNLDFKHLLPVPEMNECRIMLKNPINCPICGKLYERSGKTCGNRHCVATQSQKTRKLRKIAKEIADLQFKTDDKSRMWRQLGYMQPPENT